MGIMYRATKERCAKCQYRMYFGSKSKKQVIAEWNIACNYLQIEGHSRRRDEQGNIQPLSFKGYCDKFVEGDKIIVENDFTEKTGGKNEQT